VALAGRRRARASEGSLRCDLARLRVASRVLFRWAKGGHDEDEDAARRVEQWNQGNRTIPTLDIDGTILTNPSPAQLRQVLGL